MKRTEQEKCFGIQIDSLSDLICFGRFFVRLLHKTGSYKLANRFLRSGISRKMIPRYIEKHHINMQDFKGQNYEKMQ